MNYRDKAIDSFKTKFKIYLFDYANNGNISKISLNDFRNYKITEEVISEYTHAWQIRYKDDGGNKIKQIDDLIINFEENNQELIKELQNDYIENVFPKIFPKNKFENLIKTEKCYYCGITKEEIFKLIEKKKIYKKQLTRGWTFEIDRKEPNEEYFEENCVMSCYWCNNAKTDEFNAEEFSEVGKIFREIWNKRLNE